MKAILVTDMPKCCNECKCNFDHFCNFDNFERYIEDLEQKPDWCLFRPLPKRKMPKFGEAYPQSMTLIDRWKGYDECLDDILGETE